MQQTTDLLLASGAAIGEINTLRKHISLVKGGQLARAVAPATLITLVLSDVIGSPLDNIASGPAVPDTSTWADAWAVVERYDLAGRLPASIRRRLQAGREGTLADTPKPGDPIFDHTQTLIVADNAIAAVAAQKEAENQGYHSLVLSTFVEGEAGEVAKVAVALAREVQAHDRPLPAPACLILGGETTVTLGADPGKGGRNQELALAAAVALAGTAGITVISLATDGTDGPTDAAGGVADGETVARGAALGSGCSRHSAPARRLSFLAGHRRPVSDRPHPHQRQRFDLRLRRPAMIDPTLPLIDLHRHLDGAVRLQTIVDLGRQHNLPLPSFDLEELRPHVQVTTPQPGVMAFLQKFKWMVGVLVDYDACRRIAYENVQDAQREGIAYIELRFSPEWMARPHSLDVAGVVEAVADGAEAAGRDLGVGVNLIGILSRHFGPQVAHEELQALLSQRDRLAALDLAGDEANWPGELFVDHFRRARDAGWQITVHAGEAAGPESVWQAIEGLGATRIGHAVRAGEDPALLDAMAERGVGIEANLTSNVQTSTVPDYVTHPLKSWLDRGLLATINSDDPGISAIDLPYEYEVAAPAAGLTPAHIRQAQANAMTLAFLTPDQKQALAEKFSA